MYCPFTNCTVNQGSPGKMAVSAFGHVLTLLTYFTYFACLLASFKFLAVVLLLADMCIGAMTLAVDHAWSEQVLMVFRDTLLLPEFHMSAVWPSITLNVDCTGWGPAATASSSQACLEMIGNCWWPVYSSRLVLRSIRTESTGLTGYNRALSLLTNSLALIATSYLTDSASQYISASSTSHDSLVLLFRSLVTLWSIWVQFSNLCCAFH